jgi:hypothetical protein
MGLRVEHELEVGEEVTLEFLVPGSASLVMEASVSWCDSGKAGLRFTRLNPVSLGRIMNCLAA